MTNFARRVLGLDIGKKRIGVAVSSLIGEIANPVDVIERVTDKDAIDKLKKIIQELQPVKIIAGIPLGLRGEVGTESKKVLKFLNKLKVAFNLPVETIDERFSTKEVERLMIQADVSRKKRKKSQDTLAAVLILQRYLDRCER